MPLSKPIRLTIYDPETSEPVKDLSTAIVPWGIMKRAIALMRSLPEGYEEMSEAELVQNMSEDFVDSLTAYVVDLFGGRVTVEELNHGAELSEMLPLLTAAGVGGLANPTKPGKETPRTK